MKLIIFDVDGTLVDSQFDIIGAMQRAYRHMGLECPNRDRILSIVGLSLDQAFARLSPELKDADHQTMAQAYKDAYVELRAQAGAAQSSPLYPNVRAVLDQLQGMPEWLLGVATGKSKRGLDSVIKAHELQGLFVTQQVADHHPSKPHPAMLLTALADTGVDAADAVMVGDTTYDIDMAAAAGVTSVAVSWGYHQKRDMQHADYIIDCITDLPLLLDKLWSTT